MSGAQIAHFLKQVGEGSELAGVETIFRTGWIVGVGQTLLAGVAAYGAYRLGKWGYEKVREYIEKSDYITACGEVV